MWYAAVCRCACKMHWILRLSVLLILASGRKAGFSECCHGEFAALDRQSDTIRSSSTTGSLTFRYRIQWPGHVSVDSRGGECTIAACQDSMALPKRQLREDLLSCGDCTRASSCGSPRTSSPATSEFLASPVLVHVEEHPKTAPR